MTSGYSVMRCEDNIGFVGSLPDESINLIFTSPPYNIGKSYEKKTSLMGKPVYDRLYLKADIETASFTGKFDSVRQDWTTPQSLFAQMNSEFCFTLDAAASKENTLVQGSFFSKEDDSTQL